MLIKVWVESYHPKIVEIPDDYDFIIKEPFKVLTKEETEKVEDFYPLLYDIMGISEEEADIKIDFEASQAGVEKKIDTAIKKWFCDNDEDWKNFFKTRSINDAFQSAGLDSYDLEDLIEWLRIFCD